MKETELNYLLNERERLLNAWRTSEGTIRIAILTRIEDIDDKLSDAGNYPSKRDILPRRFFRR